MSLSRKWRTTSSQIKEIELANSLRSLERVVGNVLVGKAPMKLRYGTDISYQQGQTIAIDSRLATKQTPIDSNDFDVLCGLSLHEATHKKVGTNHISYRATPNLSGTKLSYDSIVQIGEEIYVDNTVSQTSPIHASYIKKAREAYGKDMKVNWDNPVESWLATSVYGIPFPQDINQKTLKILNHLFQLSEDLKTKVGKSWKRVWLEHSAREKLYRDCWEKVRYLVEKPQFPGSKPRKKLDRILLSQAQQEYDKWKKQQKPDVSLEVSNDDFFGEETWADKVFSGEDLDEQESVEPSESKKETQLDSEEAIGESKIDELGFRSDETVIPDFHQKYDLDEELKELVEEALLSESEDITNEIDNITNVKCKHPIVFKLAQSKPIEDFETSLVRELEWLRELKNSTGKVVYNGEPKGKVNGRQLFRVKTDGLIFKKIFRQPQKDISLVLLLDASGSMGGKESIYKAASSAHRIIPETKVFSYTDAPNTGIVIQNHTIGKKFLEIIPTSNTPSGIALLVMAVKFPSSLIVHFTDGLSNVGTTPQDALQIITDKFPNTTIINVIYQGDIRQYNGAESNKITNIMLRDLSYFPNLLRDSVKKWYNLRR